MSRDEMAFKLLLTMLAASHKMSELRRAWPSGRKSFAMYLAERAYELADAMIEAGGRP